LLGVSDRDRVEPVARVLLALGTKRALVVHGGGGVDELSLEGENVAIFVETGAAPRPFAVDARALGLKAAPISALRGGDAVENAVILRHVFSGERGPARDAVVLNAAAALWVAERAPDLADGARLAARALDDGSAGRTLDAFISATRRHAEGTAS
jgi:anthranilate phosphoribosyltransferase